jgi:hypothetical protein
MNNPKLLKGILSIVVVLVLGMFLLYYFGYNDIKTKNENILTLKNNLVLQTEKQKYASSMEKIIQNTDLNMTRINNSIVNKGEDVKFIEDMEGIAKNNNLLINIDSLAVDENPAFSSADMVVLKVKASVSGSWSGVYSFLLNMESLPFRTKIDKFAMINNKDQVMAGGKVVSREWQGIFEMSILKYK